MGRSAGRIENDSRDAIIFLSLFPGAASDSPAVSGSPSLWGSEDPRGMLVTTRRDLVALLSIGPRSVSSLARELGLTRSGIEDHLAHALRSARAAGSRIVVVPARCKACGFLFDESKLVKPGRCPVCRGTRVYEPQIGIEPSTGE